MKNRADKPAGHRRRLRVPGYITGKGFCSLHFTAGDKEAVSRVDRGKQATQIHLLCSLTPVFPSSFTSSSLHIQAVFVNLESSQASCPFRKH